MPVPESIVGSGKTKVATEVWNFPRNQSIHSPICSSVYEDAPLNYLIDYAIVNGWTARRSRVCSTPGFRCGRREDFLLSVPDHGCNTAYNSIPIHLENTKFPTVGPQALNLLHGGSFRAVTTF